VFLFFSIMAKALLSRALYGGRTAALRQDNGFLPENERENERQRCAP
jgi:hypothetical protein